MEARIDGMVRGIGCIYVNIFVSGIPSPDGLQVAARTDADVPLPARWYPFGQDVGAGPDRHIVVVIPLLETGAIIIAPMMQDGDGGTCPPLRITMERAKWESRFVYRARAKLAARIRDIESQGANDRIDVQFWRVLPDGEHVVVRAELRMPYHADTQLELTVLDGQGRPTDIVPTIMSEAVDQPQPLEPHPIRRLGISIRALREGGGFTLTCRDLNHPELTGFRSAERNLFNRFIHESDSLCSSAAFDKRYDKLFRARRANAGALIAQSRAVFSHKARFSIVVPLFNTPLALFCKMLESVLAQSYSNWELVLVNASPGDERLAKAVRDAAASDARIRFVMLDENLGITENTNMGVAACTGDFVCFLDHDDMLEPSALFEYACAIEEQPDADLLYCDEDILSENGAKFYNPHFKPDFDIDLLRSQNYVCHFLCIRKSVLDEIEPPTSKYDGAQDHNLTLRVAEQARGIVHVPLILYHWRAAKTSTASATKGVDAGKSYANEAGRIAIAEHLERLGIPAVVEPGPAPFSHHVKYLVQGSPLVSIIIPNKDCAEMLERCVGSILDKTTYRNYEIVIVENNSTEPETSACYGRLKDRDSRVSVVTWPGEFNFSKIVNFGARHAKGEFFLPLNNDTEVISPEWLENMLGACQREDVGIVGALLLYPDNTIQHAGVVIVDQWMPPCHAYYGLPESNWGYFNRNALTHQHLAVTGACFITARETFEQVGGFAEDLAVAYNDIDYCLKVRDRGLAVVYEPTAKLHHYESLSRGLDAEDERKTIRQVSEAAILLSRWAEVFVKGDPFLNPNIGSSYYSLRWS